MKTKKKISLTIDSDLYSAIEEAARTFNLAKSHLAQEAFKLWLKNKTEMLMAQGYEDMSAEDKTFADLTTQAQSEIL